MVFIPQYFRVIRAETIRLKAEPFVESAKVVGASSIRIMGRHIFKNATRTLPLIFTLNASEAILTLAGLGFLGFGIEPTSAAEWGFDLNKALADTTSGIWWTGVFPGLAIVLTVLGLTLVGESINDLNDPRLRGRKTAAAGKGGPDSTASGPGSHRSRSEKLMTINIDQRRARGAGPVLDIDHLKVTFATDAGDVYAVKDVSLEVNPGEVLAIVGESGSGKTVTAKTILGLLPETATSSRRCADQRKQRHQRQCHEAPADPRPRRGHGLPGALHRPEPGVHRRLADRRRHPCPRRRSRPKRVTAKDAKARAIEALRKVGIPDPETRVNYYPHQFSGGQKQRVVIAAALALNPGLIVADEPTTALDVTVQAEILELLRDLRDKYGTSIVLITHNMGVVADLADRVVVMYQGDVVEEAPARALFAEPQAGLHQEAAGRRPAPRPELGLGRTDGTGPPRRQGAGGGQGPDHRVPRPAGQPGLQGRGRRQLHRLRGRGLWPGGRIRFRKNHHRPGHRRAEPDHRRQPEGARLRDAQLQGADLQAAPEGHRLRVPGSGRVLQPAADHRRLRGGAADHPHQPEPGAGAQTRR